MEEVKVDNNKLSRSLGLLQAIAIVVGTTIGSGVFFKPAKVFYHGGSFTGGILAWVIAGFITICAALTTAEIATAIPKTGGMYAYIKELYGDAVAFLLGWAQTLIYTPATVAAMSVMFSTFFAELVPLSKGSQIILSIAVVTIMVISNSLSVKIGGNVQSVATFLKLIPLALMILTGLFLGKINPVAVSYKADIFKGSLGFGSAIIACLWAYDGWNTVANMGGEMKNPAKDLPKSMIIGLSIITSVYVLLNVAIARVIPLNTIIQNEGTAVKIAADTVMGPIGSLIISVGILISLYGSLNGYFLSGVRVPYAMAENNLLPFSNKLSKVNKLKSPIVANILILVLTVLYILSGTFNTLTNLVVFVLWIFFTLMVCGIFIIRKREDLVSTYRVPFYPIIPILGIAGGLYILYSSFMDDYKLALIGVAITLSGLIVYFYKKRKI